MKTMAFGVAVAVVSTWVGCAPPTAPCPRGSEPVAPRGAPYRLSAKDREALLRDAPSPFRFVLDEARFAQEVGVRFTTSRTPDTITFELAREQASPDPTSPTLAETAELARDFLRTYERSLGLPELSNVAPAPSADGLLVFRAEGDGDPACARIRATLTYAPRMRSKLPVRVERTCVRADGYGPRFEGRKLPRTGAMARVLFFCHMSPVAKGASTFVDRYGDVYAGMPDAVVDKPRYLFSLPPEDVEAAALDAIEAHRRLETGPPLNYAQPLVPPVPDTGFGLTFCVAYVPDVGDARTMGLTMFEERGEATLPIVRLREWLASYGLTRP